MAVTNHVLGSKRTLVQTYAAAGSSTLTTSPIIDMQGFEECIFDIAVGAMTTGQTKGTVQVQGGQLANGSDMANLVGASLTIPDTANQGVTVAVFRTLYRYLQVVITRSTQSAAIGSVVATQFTSKKPPEKDDTTFNPTVLAIEPQYSQTYYTTSTVTLGNTSIVSTYRSAS